MSAQYINTNAASLRMGFSASTLKRMRDDGTGPNFFRVGSKIMYDVDDLDRWAAARKRSKAAAHSTPELKPGRLVSAADLPVLLELYRQRADGLDFPDYAEAVSRTGKSDTAVRHAARRMAETGIISLSPFRVCGVEADTIRLDQTPVAASPQGAAQ